MIMRFKCVLVVVGILGCSPSAPSLDVAGPAAGDSSGASLSEADTRQIAAEVAEEVVARALREAEKRAAKSTKTSVQPADEEARLLQEAAQIAAEQEAAANALARRMEAYAMLVESERRRVDAIREQIEAEGLARVHPEDVQWAWHGDGRDCLADELLIAAGKPPPETDGITIQLLRLEGASLIEFYCLDPLEQLQRIGLARQLRALDTSISDEVIIQFRHDPFLKPLIADYMKGRDK
jgi:hypothetical protein